MTAMPLFGPTDANTEGSGEDYTYRRVLENGSFVMRRVAAKGPLPKGSPVFPRYAPGFKQGEREGAYSPMMEHLLSLAGSQPSGTMNASPQSLLGQHLSQYGNVVVTYPRYYSSTSTGPEEPKASVITDAQVSDTTVNKLLLPRLFDYRDRGFEWIIETAPNNGPTKVSIFSAHLGQMFTFYFHNGEAMAQWALWNPASIPNRIVRKTFPIDGTPEELIDTPTLDGYIIRGKPAEKSEEGFGRMVELD